MITYTVLAFACLLGMCLAGGPPPPPPPTSFADYFGTTQIENTTLNYPNKCPCPYTPEGSRQLFVNNYAVGVRANINTDVTNKLHIHVTGTINSAYIKYVETDLLDLSATGAACTLTGTEDTADADFGNIRCLGEDSMTLSWNILPWDYSTTYAKFYASDFGSSVNKAALANLRWLFTGGGSGFISNFSISSIVCV